MNVLLSTTLVCVMFTVISLLSPEVGLETTNSLVLCVCRDEQLFMDEEPAHEAFYLKMNNVE